MGEAGKAGEDAAGEGVDFVGEDGGAAANDAAEREPVDDVTERHFEIVGMEGAQAALEGGGKEVGLNEIDEREDFSIHLGRREHKTPRQKDCRGSTATLPTPNLRVAPSPRLPHK